MRVVGMDRRVTIEQQAGTRGVTGEVIGAWSEVATVWAEIRQTRGDEVREAGQELARVTTKIRIRWRPDVRTAMRVTWTDPAAAVAHVYDILDANDITGRRDELWLQCREVGAN